MTASKPEPDGSTATTAAARAHARSMEGTVVPTMPVVPPSAAPDRPAGVDAADMCWHEVLAPGGYTSFVVARGTRVRLVDLEGDACAGVLLHRHGHPSERLNIADTVKVQWQAYLHQGQLLLSDMGRVLAAIETDTSGRHDTICGTTNRAANEARYGEGGMDGPSPNGRDLFALALTKQGRTGREVAPNVNFFVGTRVDPDGTIRLLDTSAPRAEVVLRCELDLLVTIVNVPHPLDDREQYTVTPLQVSAWRGDPPAVDDTIRVATPEGRRAYENTEMAAGMLS
ncbi:MAG: urea amidolyase associated protein UAAP1 [Actinomycetota bacterium]